MVGPGVLRFLGDHFALVLCKANVSRRQERKSHHGGTEARRHGEKLMPFAVCHPDRSATTILPFQEICGAEWRDPEGVSLFHAASGRSPQSNRRNRMEEGY